MAGNSSESLPDLKTNAGNEVTAIDPGMELSAKAVEIFQKWRHPIAVDSRFPVGFSKHLDETRVGLATMPKIYSQTKISRTETSSYLPAKVYHF
ncbi:MAG TPA: hypothetical protein DCE41_19255 [Cytophagales bacterium]|nr:hypothetical protein [Cytophagales bacterium]HAA18077.1 hypothetical protein [Cytophagales bacterium]HAP62470.1 hypothetical protein [Cytophagales bacterium]